MKVVEGNFGQEKDKITLAESMSEIMAKTDLGEVAEGRFILIVDTPDRMSFVTNEHNPEGAVYLLEQIKHAVITGGIAE